MIKLITATIAAAATGCDLEYAKKTKNVQHSRLEYVVSHRFRYAMEEQKKPFSATFLPSVKVVYAVYMPYSRWERNPGSKTTKKNSAGLSSMEGPAQPKCIAI